MKKLIKISWLLAIVINFTSCNEEEFITVKNENNIDRQTLLESISASDASKLVAGAYSDMQTSGLYARYGYFLFDHMSDEFLISTNSNDPALNQVQTLTINPLSESTRLFYSASFRGIFKANTAINILRETKSPNISEGEKIKYTAEARFLRGFYYFQLVTRYGGLPIEDGLESFKPRSSEREVYEFIIEDFKFASENLPDKNSTQKGRVTSGSAYGMLGKAILFSIKPENAGTAAAIDKYKAAYEALDEGNFAGYALMDDYLANFTESDEFNDESLFEVGFLDKQGSTDAWGEGDGDNETSFQSADYSGWGNSRPTKKMMEAYEGEGVVFGLTTSTSGQVNLEFNNAIICNVDSEGELIEPYDLRIEKTWWINGENFGTGRFTWGLINKPGSGRCNPTPVDNKNKLQEDYTKLSGDRFNSPRDGGLACRKYSRMNTDDTQVNSESGANYRLLRYAEVILLRAEAALFKDGGSGAGIAEAVELMNRLRKRAGLSKRLYGSPANTRWSVSTVEETFDALKHERQVELAVEGKRLVDLFRWNDDIKELSDVKTTYTRETGRYLPIPQIQIDTNPLIKPENPVPDPLTTP